MTDRLQLTQEERFCSLYRKLDQHTKDQIERQRKTNDGEHLDERKTAAIRGRISELKKLRLNLGMDTSPEDAANG